MGSIYLDGNKAPSLEKVCKDAGLSVQLWDGWQTRSRSSGGYNSPGPIGIVVHHTASPSTTSFQSDWSYCAVGHPDAPVANMLLGRQGQLGIHAAGAANHAGKGGPWNTSRGQIPLDSANSYTIGIEAGNNGTGENWAPQMVDAYLTLVAALCKAYGMDPLKDIMAHFEWAPTRKIDPWGGNTPTPGYEDFTGPRQWIMNTFRQHVKERMSGAGPSPSGDVSVYPWWLTRSAS